MAILIGLAAMGMTLAVFVFSGKRLDNATPWGFASLVGGFFALVAWGALA